MAHRITRKVLSADVKALAAAREVVNGFKFGDAEWEAAMIEVRRLVEAVDFENGLHLEPYHSIDGDIFNSRAA